MSENESGFHTSSPRRKRQNGSGRRQLSSLFNYKRMGRELAMQFLFQCDLTDGVQTPELCENFWQQAVESGEFPMNRIFRKAKNYATRLLAGIEEHETEIVALIADLSREWEADRISAVDRNIMKVAIYEMKYCPEIPVLVSINEAIEIAKSFSSERSGNFINGILNSVKNMLPEKRPADVKQDDEE